MTPEEFVRRVRQSVIDDSIPMYRSLYAARFQESTQNPYGSAVRRVIDSLDGDGRDALSLIIRQIEVDTIATLFGIFDGTSQLDGRFERFKLSYWGSRHDDAPLQEEVILSGDLQDYFFAQEQDEEG
jgi:hypothetical protein